jgi:hypothetical protein
MYIKNRAGKFAAISPLASYVTGLPTGSLEPRLKPKLLEFRRPLEKEKCKKRALSCPLVHPIFAANGPFGSFVVARAALPHLVLPPIMPPQKAI